MKNQWVIATVLAGKAHYLVTVPGDYDSDDKNVQIGWSSDSIDANRYGRRTALQIKRVSPILRGVALVIINVLTKEIAG